MEAPDRIRLLEDRTLGHAAVLVERLIFWSRHLGLMSRFNHDEDPLGPLCVNDDEVSTMLASLRRSRAAGRRPPGIRWWLEPANRERGFASCSRWTSSAGWA
jgi:hypothetical protein